MGIIFLPRKTYDWILLTYYINYLYFFLMLYFEASFTAFFADIS